MTGLLSLVIGIVLLFIGGEGLVRGSVTISERLQLSTLLIGTIVIGFGTSAPELVVSLDAVFSGFPDIALGNVIGSNIANTLFVLAIAALITEIPCRSHQLNRDAAMGVAAAVFLSLLGLTGSISRMSGLAMVLTLIVYLAYTIWSEKKRTKNLDKQIKKDIVSKKMSLPISALMAVISIILLALGAHFLVNGAVSIANYFGVSKAVIGLTIVAVGTSIPELVTVCIASWHKHTNMVIGNILGSNLFNILSIIGIAAIVKPIPFTGQIAKQDVWIMVATSTVLMIIILSSKKINRWIASVFLALYCLYVLWLYTLR